MIELVSLEALEDTFGGCQVSDGSPECPYPGPDTDGDGIPNDPFEHLITR